MRYDSVFLSKLLDSEQYSTDWPKKKAQAWCDSICERMNQETPPSVSYRLSVVEAEESLDLNLERITHGVTEPRLIKRDFFRSPDYRLIGRVATILFGLIQEGAKVHRGNADSPVSSFDEAYQWLMQESRKGRTIQRFKGLGEMNPEQLWDTTVNPETRRLLQVTIDDAYVADEVFTTLMGDEVEPRREFIERNALDASNLDI
jgi:DNA gyrase subunit B